MHPAAAVLCNLRRRGGEQVTAGRCDHREIAKAVAIGGGSCKSASMVFAAGGKHHERARVDGLQAGGGYSCTRRATQRPRTAG